MVIITNTTGDGYVHRLIQSKTDGKLVEVPSPAPTCPHGSPSIHHHRRHQQHHRQRSTGDGRLDPLCRSRSGSSAAAAGACSSGNEADGDTCSSGNCPCPVCADEHREMKEVMVSSKLEAISLEYNHLLATQLDSQRQYFEGLLVQQDSKQQAAVAAVKAAAEQAQAASEAAAAAAKESERKRQQLDHKLVRKGCCCCCCCPPGTLRWCTDCTLVHNPAHTTACLLCCTPQQPSHVQAAPCPFLAFLNVC